MYSNKSMQKTIKHNLGVRLYRPPIRAFFRLMYRILTNLHIEGMENIPSHSGYLLTINHLSLYDPPLALSFWSYAPEALGACLLYTSPSPRDLSTSRMPSSA